MAANPYEVEHNIKPAAAQPAHRRRRPDMSSFTSHYHSLTSPAGSRLGPTPVDAAALYRLLQDQMLATTMTMGEGGEGGQEEDTPGAAAHRDLMASLVRELERDIDNPPARIPGVDQPFLDALDRVPAAELRRPHRADDNCPICAERFVDDPYPLVVELPCGNRHAFDLECVGPWLLGKGTCPLCRADLTKKKTIEIPKDDDDEEDGDADGLYG
ncbi:putative ring finger-like protein [Rosellinia necatrix]|uniref:Putative ring finger-like protein n=1 Tax=Rosellinia necatrix TaxID=77044 RepID=A0A1W2TG76_ROSNE|nr:putative ring finger-like protein [Rosellinia necatrix]